MTAPSPPPFDPLAHTNISDLLRPSVPNAEQPQPAIETRTPEQLAVRRLEPDPAQTKTFASDEITALLHKSAKPYVRWVAGIFLGIPGLLQLPLYLVDLWQNAPARTLTPYEIVQHALVSAALMFGTGVWVYVLVRLIASARSRGAETARAPSQVD